MVLSFDPHQFQLEPGPVFSINRKESLEEFARLIDDCEALRDRVGINLDVSHFRLGDVPVDFVRNNPSIPRWEWSSGTPADHDDPLRRKVPIAAVSLPESVLQATSRRVLPGTAARPNGR